MNAESSALLSLREVTIGHGLTPLLRGIDLEVLPGDFLAVVGPNGAGKTTLLSTMLGSLRPLAGSVRRKEGLIVGYVPQRGRHDPVFGLTVSEVVGSGGLGLGSWGSWDFHFAPREAVREVLGQLGIAALENRLLRELSGGQQQRVLVARALVRRPALLVLDEPTAGLDLPSERDLLENIAGVSSRSTTAVVLVTHQLALAARHASRLALMNKDTGLFALDTTRELLDDRRLSALFGRAMTAHRCEDGDWNVHPIPGGSP
jgi:ABC-type Mn2+/Zn2+ transport system ATPase subunit